MMNVPAVNCVCHFCQDRKAFSMPMHILDAAKSRDLVIFAGAGISTEGKRVFPRTLYEDVARELGVNPLDGPPFPKLMSDYSVRPDGRQRLLGLIKKRFDYCNGFPEVYRNATRFHRALATIPQIENIITTNWDDFFERECGATPYVSPEDFALWKLPGRKIFKIHGSINSVGSIVATVADYEACYERLATGLIGSVLKTMLATKTIVYVGYSFSDTDFSRIHELLTSEMKGVRPHSYLVTLDEAPRTKLTLDNVTPIVAEGADFVVQLKKHLIADGAMIDTEVFSGVDFLLQVLRAFHDDLGSLDLNKYPYAAYTLAYQDGLLHALERIQALKKAGKYSTHCDISSSLHPYEKLRSEALKQKNYWEASYITGYQYGHAFLLRTAEERRTIPLFYVYGATNHPENMQDYMRVIRKGASIHKTAFRLAKAKVTRKTQGSPEITLHHPPFL